METLKKGLLDYHITPTEKMMDRFSRYESLLLEWNEKMNLTAITEHEEVLKKHFVDSVAIQSLIPEGARLADVGTGAGFPGIPLKIVRDDIEVVLMDALKKRISFLDAVISDTSLSGITTLHTRAEDAGRVAAHREKYDIAVARAVANLAVLCEYCLPLLKCGGIFLAMKGRDGRAEAEEAKNAIKILGGELLEIRDVFWGEMEHTVVVIQKKRQTPSKYPRKAGTPQKSPLL